MIKSWYRDNAYFLSMCIPGDINVVCKFDTGAVQTIIPIQVLLKRTVCESERTSLFQQLVTQSKKGKPVKFQSASGDEILGIKCHVKDIIIGDTILPELYYYLTNSGRRVALLGADFISCCSFKHLPGGDILIDNIDLGMYSRNSHGEYVDSKDILEIMKSVTEKSKSTSPVKMNI